MLGPLGGDRELCLTLRGVDRKGNQFYMAPKLVKREHWVNVYRDNRGETGITVGGVYSSKEGALAGAAEGLIEAVLIQSEMVQE